MDDRGTRLEGGRTPRFAAHAAPLGGDAHGLARSRPAHRADRAGTRRHLHHAGLHARGAGPAAEGVRRASSAGAQARAHARTRASERKMQDDSAPADARAVSQSGRARSPDASPADAGAGRTFCARWPQRNASAHTVKAYGTDLAEFVRFVGPEELKADRPPA